MVSQVSHSHYPKFSWQSGPAMGDLQVLSASSKCRLQPTPGKLRRSERGSPNVYVLTINLQFWRVYTTHLQWIWGSLFLGFTTLSIFQPSGPSPSSCGSKHFKTQVITQGLYPHQTSRKQKTQGISPSKISESPSQKKKNWTSAKQHLHPRRPFGRFCSWFLHSRFKGAFSQGKHM